MMNVLLKPLVTEKASSQNEFGKYGFIVNQKANKIQIKEAVEKSYGVNVVSVNTLTYQGKKKNRYTKSRIISGKTSGFKKAVVQVAEGEVIDFYSNI